jgi:hypothetical protein
MGDAEDAGRTEQVPARAWMESNPCYPQHNNNIKLS